MSTPVTIFFSYADNKQDRALFAQLEKHLKIFEHNGRIASWNKQDVLAGQNRQQEIDAHFEQAQIILLLISPDFVASPFCYQNEMKHALERQARGDAYVIPILLRDVYYKDAPFAQLAALPADGRFVSSWGTRTDKAFAEITTALSEIITKCAAMPPRPSAAPQALSTTIDVPISSQKEPAMHEDMNKLILDAMTYGVKAQATVPEAKDDYEELHTLLARRFVENADAQYAFRKFLQKPQDWRGPFLEALESLQIERDQAIMATVERLLALKREQSTSKFAIYNSGHIGQQYIGDNHQSTHHYGETKQNRDQR